MGMRIFTDNSLFLGIALTIEQDKRLSIPF